MAVLKIDWKSMPRIQPEQVITGQSESKPEAAAAKLQKPLVIFIEEMASSIPQAGGFDKINELVWTEDKIVIASKAFTCVKMSPEQASKDPIISKAFKEVPAVVMMDIDYDATTLEGEKIDISSVWNNMESLFKKAYKGNLEKMCKEMIKVLAEFDSINNDRKLLAAKKERTEKPSETDKKEWEKELKELDQRQKIAEKKKDDLLKLEPRV